MEDKILNFIRNILICLFAPFVIVLYLIFLFGYEQLELDKLKRKDMWWLTRKIDDLL